MKKITKIALAASLLVGGIASTQACSLGAWDDNATSTSLAGGPAEAGANNFARATKVYALCKQLVYHHQFLTTVSVEQQVVQLAKQA